jgi:hypothetical protein
MSPMDRGAGLVIDPTCLRIVAGRRYNALVWETEATLLNGAAMG